MSYDNLTALGSDEADTTPQLTGVTRPGARTEEPKTTWKSSFVKVAWIPIVLGLVGTTIVLTKKVKGSGEIVTSVGTAKPEEFSVKVLSEHLHQLHKDKRKAPIETLLATEKHMRKLAAAVVAGTAVDEPTDDIYDQVVDLMNTQMEFENQTKINIEAELAAALEEIHACNQQVITSLAEAKELGGKADGAEENHTYCRSIEERLKIDMDEKCEIFESFKEGLQLDECSCDNELKELPCLNLLTNWDPAQQLKLFRYKRDNCDNATAVHADKRAECSVDQVTLEEKFCMYSDALKSTCEVYDTCYKTTVDAYKVLVPEKEEEEAITKASYEAAVMIVCYVDVLLNDETETSGDQNEQLDNCDNLVVDTSHLDVIYPPIPDVEVCDTEPADPRPCVEDWLESRYFSKSWYEKAPTQECTTCPIPAFLDLPAGPPPAEPVGPCPKCCSGMHVQWDWKITSGSPAAGEEYPKVTTTESSVRFDFADDYKCGGWVKSVQGMEAVATVNIDEDTTFDLFWEGVSESSYEWLAIYVNFKQVAYLQAKNDGVCKVSTCIMCETLKQKTKVTIPKGESQILVKTNTNDGLYHKHSFFIVRFGEPSCEEDCSTCDRKQD